MKTRNLLRGLQDRKSPESSIQTLNNLRQRSSILDLRIAVDVLADDPLYAHLRLPPEFPNAPPNLDEFQQQISISLEKQLTIFFTRLKCNEDKICSALEFFGKLNDAILEKDFDVAITHILKIIELFGHSLFLLKKVAFIYTHTDDPSEVKEYCLDYLNNAGLTSKNLIALGITDVMGETYTFSSIRKNLLDTKSNGVVAQTFIDNLIDSVFLPTPTSKAQCSAFLQSHFQSSLIDAVLFVNAYSTVLDIIPSYLDGSIAEEAMNFQNTSVGVAIGSLSKQQPPGQLFYSKDDIHSDFSFYRHSCAWFENEKVIKYRCAVDPYFLAQTDATFVRSDKTRDIARSFFSTISSMKDLTFIPKQTDIQLDIFDTERAGIFSRTTAFLYSLGNTGIDQVLDGEEILTIMDGTRDIALLSNPNYLRQLQSNDSSVSNNKMLNFVVCLLIAERTGLNIDDHKLRRLLQDIVINDFSGSLLCFMDFLESKAPAVSFRLFEMCNETFLGKLFFLIPEPEQVFELRAQLLDWQATNSSEPLYAERAKTLRIDQRIQKARGEVDDVRIYVDSLRLNQWIQSNQLDELSAIFTGKPIPLEGVDAFLEPGDFLHRRLLEVRLAMVLSKTFEEFCKNRKFGIASYLGRRIRHGTLEGTLFRQLKMMLMEGKYSPIMQVEKSNEFYKRWLDNYKEQIDEFGLDFLQIKSDDKPHGAFDTNIFSKAKIQQTRVALREIIKAYNEHKNLLVIANLLQSYCWRLIEVDLKKIRDSAASGRTHWGTINQSMAQKVVPDELKILSQELNRNINLHTDSRFKTLSSWFNEPKNLSPSAPITLLFDVVLEEVKEQFPHFNPKVEHQGQLKIILKGGAYHLVYDAMKVAIENMARHGNQKGKLIREFQLQHKERDTSHLTVGISSEIPKNSSSKEVSVEIKNAINGDYKNAMDVEGKSGFKKLLQLKDDTRELIEVEAYAKDRFVVVNCVYELNS